jgi:hypothetical protein
LEGVTNDEGIEKSFRIIDELIDRDIDVTNLSKELPENEYHAVRTRVRRYCGHSIKKLIKEYGIFDKIGNPSKVELERCFFIDRNHEVMINIYQKESIMSLYLISEKDFKKFTEGIKNDLEKDALDNYYRKEFPFSESFHCFKTGHENRHLMYYFTRQYNRSMDDFLSAYGYFLTDLYKCERKNVKRTNESMLSSIRDLHDKRKAHTDSVCEIDSNLYALVYNRFGSWGKAFKEATGLSYKKEYLNVDVKYGLYFEPIVGDIMRDIGIEYKEKLSGIKGCLPDYIISRNHWIDAKLADTTVFNGTCETIEKYEPHVRRLDIVYLISRKNYDPVYAETEKTNQINVRYLLRFLPETKRKPYEDKLDQLVADYEREKGVSDESEAITHE